MMESILQITLTTFIVIIGMTKDAAGYILIEPNQIKILDKSNITIKGKQEATKSTVIAEKIQPKKKELNNFHGNPAKSYADYPANSKAYSMILEIFGIVIFLIIVGFVVLATRNKYRLSKQLNLIKGKTDDPRPEWTYQTPSVSNTMSTVGWSKEIPGPAISYVNSRTIRLLAVKKDISITAAVYNLGISSGKHVFACMWPREQKYVKQGHLFIGLGHPSLETYTEFTDQLLGSTNKSLGFDLLKNHLIFDGTKIETYPRGKSKRYNMPTLFYMYVDMDDRKLLFGSETEFWGVAFNFQDILPAESGLLYPMVACRGVEGKFMMFYKGQVCTPLLDTTSMQSSVLASKQRSHYDILERIKLDIQETIEENTKSQPDLLQSLSCSTTHRERHQASSHYHNPAFDYSDNCEPSTSSAGNHARSCSNVELPQKEDRHEHDNIGISVERNSSEKIHVKTVHHDQTHIDSISGHKDVYKSSQDFINQAFTSTEPEALNSPSIALEFTSFKKQGFSADDQENDYVTCHL